MPPGSSGVAPSMWTVRVVTSKNARPAVDPGSVNVWLMRGSVPSFEMIVLKRGPSAVWTET